MIVNPHRLMVCNPQPPEVVFAGGYLSWRIVCDNRVTWSGHFVDCPECNDDPGLWLCPHPFLSHMWADRGNERQGAVLLQDVLRYHQRLCFA